MASLNTLEFEPRGVRLASRAPTPASSGHQRLIRLARDGQREAFDSLIRAHEDGLRSFLAHRIELPELDDVIQDVLVAAWRALPSYDGRSQFRTWLFAIAFNKVRDHYRQKMRRVTEVRAPEVEAASHAEVDPYAAKDLSLAVRELVKILSDSQQEVILLYYQDELTLAEIAAVLNRNLSTVKYQFFQAHSKLADHMRRSPEWSSWITPPKREGSK